MFKFHDVEQNTDEWYGLRAGKLTSSKLGVIMANENGAFTPTAKKYAVGIALEQETGNPKSNSFTNEHMQRGHEQEPLARALYEERTFCTVSNGGFFGSDFVGCSPDGLVYDDGVIEIKSVIESVHYANVKRKKADPAYKWQCIGNLKFTGRDWMDFVSYCADYPEDKQLYIYRMHKRDLADEFKRIDLRIKKFRQLVDRTKSSIDKSNYNRI